MKFKYFPKVELHLHLDCSLSYSFVSKINPNISHEEYCRDFVAPPKCSNLLDYLARAPKAIALMQTDNELTLSVEDLFQQLSADHIIYAELRFAPLEHLEKGLTPEEVVDIVEKATISCSSSYNIEARVILCTLRHYDAQKSMKIAELVDKFKSTSVAAMDIAGDEAGYPIDAHKPAFQWARKRGLNITAHAGEARGPESVWETLQHFQPDRIGHGANAARDTKLIDYLVDHRIHLEICPTSNVQTNLCDRYDDHPVDELLRRGVRLNINTDGRGIANLDLTTEYQRLQKYFGWSEEQFKKTNLMALDAAFIDDPTRRELKSRWHSEIP